MEEKQEEKKPIVIQTPERSFNYFIRRFIAFSYNFLFVILFIICFFLIGVILSALLSLVFGDFPLIIIQIFFYMSPVAAFLLISYKTSQGKQTPGNKNMAFVVVGRNDNYLTFSKTLLRNLLWILSALPLGIGLIWAVFNPSCRGWHDLILGTRVASIKADNEAKIPKLPFIALILGIIGILLFVFPFATMAGTISSVEFVWIPLIISFIIIPVTFILGVISRIMTRKKEKKSWGKKLASYSITLSLIVGILFVLTAIAIPSNRLIVYIHQEDKCEKEIIEIGKAIEKYINIKHEYPEKLGDLVENQYLKVIPKFQYSEEYIYKIEKDDGREYFIIECPEPERLLKGKGLSPAKKCLEIKYIQGKGLVVRTEQ